MVGGGGRWAWLDRGAIYMYVREFIFIYCSFLSFVSFVYAQLCQDSDTNTRIHINRFYRILNIEHSYIYTFKYIYIYVILIY